MTAYGQGRDFEYKLINELLRPQGYWAQRAAGSHGIVDVFAIKPGQLLLIQAKKKKAAVGSGREGISGHDWNELYHLARMLGSVAVPIYADRPKRGVVQLRRIVDVHESRSQHWPSVPFVIDEVAVS